MNPSREQLKEKAALALQLIQEIGAETKQYLEQNPTETNQRVRGFLNTFYDDFVMTAEDHLVWIQDME